MKIDRLLNEAKKNEHQSSISSAEKTFNEESNSAEVFARLKTKILQIEQWNRHALLSTYALFDEAGKTAADGKIKLSLFIRIYLKISGKHDWIRVVNIADEQDEFIITVKPTFDPTAESVDKSLISHFFTDGSTNNFCLFKTGKTVGFYVIGLEEKQNTSATESTLEAARNFAVNLAASLGVQRSEWEKFAHHFLEETSDNEEISDNTEAKPK